MYTQIAYLSEELDELAHHLKVFDVVMPAPEQSAALLEGRKSFTSRVFRENLMMPTAKIKSKAKNYLMDCAKMCASTLTLRMNSVNKELIVQQINPELPCSIDNATITEIGDFIFQMSEEISLIQGVKFGKPAVIEFEAEIGSFTHARASELHGDRGDKETACRNQKWIYEIMRLGELPFGYAAAHVCNSHNPEISELLKAALHSVSIEERFHATRNLINLGAITTADLDTAYMMLPGTYNEDGEILFTPHCSLASPIKPTPSTFIAWHTYWAS